MADTIEGLMQEARTFADSRSWDQAIESYSRVLELDADNDEACRNLAQIYALRGMLKSVISTYLRLMHIYIARSDMDNAMAVANYVLLLEPESVDVRSELINMYRYRGDTAEVVARSLDLARLYTELDEGDRSIELLQNVLNDDPNNADVCRELAEMYIQYGQVERGANQYHQVADLYQANGQLEKACEALERILVVKGLLRTAISLPLLIFSFCFPLFCLLLFLYRPNFYIFSRKGDSKFDDFRNPFLPHFCIVSLCFNLV